MGKKVKINLEEPTGNFWVDNGLVVLYHRLGQGIFEADDILNKLLEDLVQSTGNQGEYFDIKSGTVKTYDKKNWVYPTNLFIKATPKAEKVKFQGKTYLAHPPVFELKLSFRGEGACDICGEHSILTDAKMWIFPFLVDPQKFGNFYPGTRRGMKLCPRCAVAGLAGYLGWLWRAQGRDALHIFLFHTDLKELERLHREIFRPLQAHAGKGGNINLAFWGSYLHETALGLLFELFSHIERSDLLTEQGRNLLVQLLGATTAPPPAPLRL
ncbi:MAG: hypothetical protein H5U36_10035, partial [Candidatus Caldatribacterium sp.]|nr:hypothetical protein [Candidatus Caldatribacterium sp.]